MVAAVNAAVGHPDMAEFGGATHEARSFAELKSAIEKGLSQAGLMLFLHLDQGAVVRKETGRDVPRIVRLLIGNPLIMKGMAKHVLDAGSYAPVTVLVDERVDGVRLSYDRMASLLKSYGNPDALEVARNLDKKSKIFCSKLQLEKTRKEYSWPRTTRPLLKESARSLAFTSERLGYRHKELSIIRCRLIWRSRCGWR